MGDVYMGCRVAAHSSVISWHVEEPTRTNLHGLGGEIQEGVGKARRRESPQSVSGGEMRG